MYGQGSSCVLLKCKPGTYFSASRSLAQYPQGGEGWVITGGNCITMPRVFYFTLLEVTTSNPRWFPLQSLLSRQGVSTLTWLSEFCAVVKLWEALCTECGMHSWLSLLTAPHCLDDILSCSLLTTCVQCRVPQNRREVQWCNAARADFLAGQKGPNKWDVLQLCYSIAAHAPFPDSKGQAWPALPCLTRCNRTKQRCRGQG